MDNLEALNPAPGALTTTVEPKPGNVATCHPPPILKIHFIRDGNTLHGYGYLIHGGRVDLLRSSENLEDIKKELEEGSSRMVQALVREGMSGEEFIGLDEEEFIGWDKEEIVGSSFFGSIGNAFASIAKSKIVNSIANAAKSVIKSPILGGALTGLAFVFPPIGIPAAGAYAAANTALKYIDQGNEAIATAKKLLKSGKNLSMKDKLALKLAIAKKERAQVKLKRIAALAKNKGDAEKRRKLHAAVVKRNREMKARGAKRIIVPPISPHQYAQVLGLVNNSRKRIRAIKESLSIPLKLNLDPKILTKYPVGPKDPVMRFWKAYTHAHPTRKQMSYLKQGQKHPVLQAATPRRPKAAA